MSEKVRASWWVGIAVLLFLSPLAFSQQPVYLTLENTGNNGSVGDIDIGPYGALQGNAPNKGTSVQIICDDFQHNVTVGESWAVNITSVSSLTNGTTGLVWSGKDAGIGIFGNQVGISMLQGYYAMADLATQLMGASGSNAGYLAYAIWAVFDASAVKSWLYGHGAGYMWAQVQSDAWQALQGKYSSSEFAGWEILTPTNITKNGPQEMFELVPEGGTALTYLLLAGFACFGTMYFKSRRRHASSVV